MSAAGSESPTVSASGGKKRALAKRTCVKCREKRARCELPDIFVPNSTTPLEPHKKCHRCIVLGLDCIVFDGERKRKPKLDPLQQPSPKRSNQQAAPREGNVVSRTSSSEAIVSHSPFYESELNETRAKDLLRNQKRGWTHIWRPFFVLIDRLQQSDEYTSYMIDKVRTKEAQKDLMELINRHSVQHWSGALENYLVWHPFLPNLCDVYSDQQQSPSRPRALLLATMCLLACKNNPDDELQRQLRKHIDQLGIQVLLSAPRDIHVVMAFVLLITHEPGLVGVSASMYDSDTRGFGLASENLLTCALKISQELGLDRGLVSDPVSPQLGSKSLRLVEASLWISLKIIEGHYALLSSAKPLEDLGEELATRAETLLSNVDDDGNPIAGPNRVTESNEISELQDIRTGFVELEKQIGRDGVLRAAGRTICYLRLKTVVMFHCSLRHIRSTVLGPGDVADKRQEILDATLDQLDSYAALKNNLQDLLRWFANRRCFRVCEQWTRIECDFVASLLCNNCIAALFNGSLERQIEPSRFVKEFRDDSEVNKMVSQIGMHHITLARQVLASIGMLDQQPLSRSKEATSSEYIRLVPSLLTAAMTIDAARTFLEATAFTLVAFGRPSSDFDIPLVVMLKAMEGIRRIEPPVLNSMADIAADYIAEMVDIMMQWNLYYSVYRHVPLYKRGDRKKAAQAPSDHTSASAMDQLASAALLASDGADVAVASQAAPGPAFDWGWDASSSSVSTTDSGGVYDLKAAFDLDSFLQDIDHLF